MGRFDEKKARLSREIRSESLLIFFRVMSAKARKLPKIIITAIISRLFQSFGLK